MALVPIEEDGVEGESGILVDVDTRGFGICSTVNSSEIYHKESKGHIDSETRSPPDFCDGRMSLALMIAMLVLGFITVFINLGVIIRTIKILRNSHTKKPSFYFIGNLAVSDFAIGLYVVIAFLLHITRKSDLWQQNTCMLQIAVAVTACQETIFTITLIAVDKYLYICHGLHYSGIVTTKRVHIAIACTWILSLLIGTLPAMGMHLGWEEACGRCVFPQIVSPAFTIVFFITSVAVPYLVIVSLYSVLLVLALKMHKARYGGSLSTDTSSRTSNFRLSFMSVKSVKKKSSISSYSSANIYKAARKKVRKQEMEAYKATLPGLVEKKEQGQLICGEEGKTFVALNVSENGKEATGLIIAQKQEINATPKTSYSSDSDSEGGRNQENVYDNDVDDEGGKEISDKGMTIIKVTENEVHNENSDSEDEGESARRYEGRRHVKISISEDDTSTSTIGDVYIHEMENKTQIVADKTQTELNTTSTIENQIVQHTQTIDNTQIADKTQTTAETADKTQTLADKTQTAEKTQTLADKTQTQADKTQTTTDRTKTTADKTQTVAEKIQTAADTTQTQADKTQTLADKTQIADKTQTLADKTQKAADKTQTQADKTQTLADKTQTLADKTQTLAENPQTTQTHNEQSPTLRKKQAERHSSCTSEDDSGEGIEPDQASSQSWHAWFPSSYLNRVMTNTRDRVLFLKKCRAVKTVGLIIISFSATYVPFVVGSLVYANEDEKRMCLLHMLSTLLYCAVVANSIANPLIYAYGYSEFRLKTKRFKGIFATERPRKT